jgi:hypothetical protein
MDDRPETSRLLEAGARRIATQGMTAIDAEEEEEEAGRKPYMINPSAQLPHQAGLFRAVHRAHQRGLNLTSFNASRETPLAEMNLSVKRLNNFL